jgi:predicted nucleic acid-binding protein
MLYLDTSAFLKLYVREQGSERVQALVAAQDHPLPVWEILELELANALRLKVFWNEITAAEAATQLALFDDRKARGLYFCPELRRAELHAAFHRLSEATPRLGCRTMDILHVACALQLAVAGFLTFDARQQTLAAEAGLEVIPLAAG